MKLLKFSMFISQSVLYYKILELMKWDLVSFRTWLLISLILIVIVGNRFLGYLDK